MQQDLSARTLRFGVTVVKLVRSSSKDYSSAIIFNQLLRAGTSVGANYEEAQSASSRNDFIYKVSIALKEARETRYWLRIISEAGLIKPSFTEELLQECEELIKIMTVIVKKSKGK